MLGYTQIESTVACLSIDVENAIEISENVTSGTDRVAQEADVLSDAEPVADHGVVDFR